MNAPISIDQQLAISAALHRYVQAADRFEEASKEFNKCCDKVRQSLPRNCRFVSNISYEHYLVSSDGDGNFEIEIVDTL